MITSGRRETSIRGSCVHSRYAENPRRVTLFFMRWLLPTGFAVRPLAWELNSDSLQRVPPALRQLPPAGRLRGRVENLRLAAPVHRGIEMALHFLLGKMLVENVVKEFVVY